MKLFLHMELKSQPEEKDISLIVKHIVFKLGLEKSTSNVEIHYKHGDLDNIYKIVVNTKENIPPLELVKGINDES